eukprot:6194532-Pleurochrysis_carterae.AAC.2
MSTPSTCSLTPLLRGRHVCLHWHEPRDGGGAHQRSCSFPDCGWAHLNGGHQREQRRVRGLGREQGHQQAQARRALIVSPLPAQLSKKAELDGDQGRAPLFGF